MKEADVWLVGEYKCQHRRRGTSWELVGVFSSKEKATAACRTSDYFVVPIIIDEDWGAEDGTDFPAEYPLAEEVV